MLIIIIENLSFAPKYGISMVIDEAAFIETKKFFLAFMTIMF